MTAFSITAIKNSDLEEERRNLQDEFEERLVIKTNQVHLLETQIETMDQEYKKGYAKYQVERNQTNLEENIKQLAVFNQKAVGELLLTAAYNGHLGTVQFIAPLLRDKNPKDNKTWAGGWTPIHHAAREGHLDVVKYLCGQVKDKNPKSKVGHTPLHLAAQK